MPRQKRKFNKGDTVHAYEYGHYKGEWEITDFEYDPYFREYYYDVKSTLDDEITMHFQQSCLETIPIDAFIL